MLFIPTRVRNTLDYNDPLVLKMLKAWNTASQGMEFGEVYSLQEIAKMGGYPNWQQLDHQTQLKIGATFAQMVLNLYVWGILAWNCDSNDKDAIKISVEYNDGAVVRKGRMEIKFKCYFNKCPDGQLFLNDPEMLEVLEEIDSVILSMEVGRSYYLGDMIEYQNYSKRKKRRITKTVHALVEDKCISDIEVYKKYGRDRYQLSFPSNLFQI